MTQPHDDPWTTAPPSREQQPAPSGPVWPTAEQHQWRAPTPAEPPFTQGWHPGYAPPATAAPPTGFAVAALILGLIALLLFWTVVGGLVLGILAIVFGAVALNGSSSGVHRVGRGKALSGLVTGVVAVAASVAFGGWLATYIDSDPSDGRCDDARFWADPDC